MEILEFFQVAAIVTILFAVGFWAFVAAIDFSNEQKDRFALPVLLSVAGSFFMFIGISVTVSVIIRHIG